jgi:hypothetical protein
MMAAFFDWACALTPLELVAIFASAFAALEHYHGRALVRRYRAEADHNAVNLARWVGQVARRLEAEEFARAETTRAVKVLVEARGEHLSRGAWLTANTGRPN